MLVIVDSLPANTEMSGIDPFLDYRSAIFPFLCGKRLSTGHLVARRMAQFSDSDYISYIYGCQASSRLLARCLWSKQVLRTFGLELNRLLMN